MASRFQERLRQNFRSAGRDATIVGVLTVLLFPLVICGVAAGSVSSPEMAAGVALTDDAKRLACFDDMAGRTPIADGIRNDLPQAASATDASVMRFMCTNPDKVTTYFVVIDLTNGTASYSTLVRNVSGRWGPFAASVAGERVSWDEQSNGNDATAGDWYRSHWTIERPSGHMRIEAESSDGKVEIQRNILCKRR